jgi:hypothetical protein
MTEMRSPQRAQSAQRVRKIFSVLSLCSVVTACVVGAYSVLDAQTRRTTRKPVPPPKKTTAPAEITCATPLGVGVKTKIAYCDVLTGRDPKDGIIVKLPPHRGVVTLRFNLHNRHTYSEEEVRMKKAYASYTAGIGVLTPDNTLLTRAAIASEFRRADDLVERISGGAGPGGVKAVAPVGSEAIALELPAELTEVSILGEKLTIQRADGQAATYSAAGRPVAVISDVTVEYVPAPAPARRGR